MSVRFGPFAFDPATGELWRDGRRVPLQRQPSRLLELLIARPGILVTRDEIRKALWGDETFVDFERSLNFCVGKLRSALRDDAGSPEFVETIPTRGYRFVAAVESEPVQPAPRIRLRAARRWASVVAIVLIAVAGAAAWYKSAHPPTPKILVVPFHNESGTADLDRVAKGVSDATVARLATPDRLGRLRVIGNAAEVQFSFKPRDMKAMGESLGAQYLLLGQLKKDDRRMRIVAHLIRVSDQTHVWATTYDSDTLDLARQSAIAEEIAKAVTARIPSA
jgi:TolB-like protein/DNA-binding winged helix-turn-helix (wHTH) protein